MKLTKDQVKEAIATIYGALCEGQADKDVIDDMGLSAEQYEQLKAAMFDAKADEVRAKPTEHVYIEYMINQINNINDLTTMIEQFKSSKQYNAMVGAVRARGEIYDKLIARGQEFGIIHKKPDRKEIVAGVLIGDLSNKELKKLITSELGKLNGLMKRYGDADIMAIEPGPLHLGVPSTEVAAEVSARKVSPPKKEVKTSRTTKAKNTKRTAGRKMVRIKTKGGERE